MGADINSATRQRESADCVAFLREVSAFQERIAAALKPLNLTLREFEVLECITSGPTAQSTICGRLNSYKASVSRCLSHLKGQGWVSCSRVPTDQRICVVELTADGNTQLEQARSRIANLLAELNTSLGDNEQRLLIRTNDYLTRLLDAKADVSPV